MAAACASALSSLEGDPGLLVAFTSEIEDPRLAAAELANAAKGVPAAGMSGKGIFTANDPLDDGCAVVAFDRSVEAGVGVGRDAGSDFRGAARRAAAEAASGIGDRAGLMMLFIDTRAGDLADAIAGAYEVCGPDVPLAGGAAGGSEPVQFADGEALGDAIVAIAVRSERSIGVGNAHSCSVVGEPAVITRANDYVIDEIGGRPAAEVYLQRVGGRAEISDETFEAMAITHPLAQPQAHGNRRLRHVRGRTPEGGLICSTQIPVGTTVEFTVLSLEELISSASSSARSSLDSLRGQTPGAALLFDCAGRRKVLGHGQAQEVKAITETFGGEIPLAGLYTDGEVARLNGPEGDFNHAVVSVTFA
jgi:hypothetical protein